MARHLIIGAGQIGSALFEVLKEKHDISIRDVECVPESHFDVLHICFPDSRAFLENVRSYQTIYMPELTILHSSVKVGTTNDLGLRVVYSPIRGRHPNLKTEMRKFTKFVAGWDIGDVDRACAIFEACGWETQAFDNPSTLEMLKLLSNVHMGLEIAWRQEIERMGCDAEAYGLWEETYRNGYMKLGQHNLMRPLMRSDPIGGHCILECTKILKEQIPSKAFDFILESNEKAKEDLCLTK